MRYESALRPTLALALCLLISSVSGCGNNAISSGEYCSTARPIVLSDRSIAGITDEDLRQIYAHNEAWLDLCR